MRERHEDLRWRLLDSPDLVANDRDLVRVAFLVAQPLEDSLARVALLWVGLLVRFQNLMDPRNERPDLRLLPQILLSLLGRFRLPQNLLDRPEIQIVLLAGLTPAHAADEYVKADPRPFVHVRNHSFPSRS